MAKNKEFWGNGLRFTCRQCGHCCRHEPGYVFLSENDLNALSSFFDISNREFTEKYCRVVDLGIVKRLSLKETKEYDCIFWDNGCSVYSARPLQCRTYPFWPSVLASREEWEKESKECPGINNGKLHSAAKIRKELKKRQDETLITIQ